MIAEQNKKYALVNLGGYDCWAGVGTCTGKIDTERFVAPVYEFKILGEDETSWFFEHDILVEIPDVSELQAKYDRLVEVHNNAMEMWRNENPADTEMELAVLKTLLRDCTIDGADMNDNIITVKLDAPNSIKGITLGAKAKILIKNERNSS